MTTGIAREGYSASATPRLSYSVRLFSGSRFPQAFFDSLLPQEYNALVNFVVHYLLPVFKYLFFAGLVGAVPVIVITAIRTAQSVFEEDEPGQRP
jgi:hypothetical protein